MPEYAYSMYKVSKTYPGGKQVLKDISLSYFFGAKIGVIGLNGAGKSTLLRIMAGLEKEFSGEAAAGPGRTIGFLPQEPALDDTKTVKENIEGGLAETVAALKRFEEISTAMADSDLSPEKMDQLINEQSQVQDIIDSQNGWEIEHTLEIAMDALRCPPGDQLAKNLSGGERRRVALCRLLLQKPDILLLDEPTNHLDAESVLWLEQHLQRYEGTVIAVTHDRYFLDNSAEWILELDRGHGIPWKGNYSSWLEQKQKRLSDEERQEEKRIKTLERELEWIRMSPRARQAKSKARINAYESLVAENTSEKIDQLEIFIPAGPRLGNVVIRAEQLSKAYEEKLLFENLSFDIPAGSIVGIIGANGTGKTTLFRLISGQEKPDSGSIVVGDTVKLSYVDQSRDTLNAENLVWEEIAGGKNETVTLGGREINSRALCARFNFTGTDQQKKVGALSGGERNRVHLAKMLRQGANVILLDEPTNDLDVNTLRALEEAILNFSGCVLVVSHDRWFLDRVATHILAFEGDSQVAFVQGNFQDYEDDKKRRLGAEAVQPTRIRYRKLTR